MVKLYSLVSHRRESADFACETNKNRSEYSFLSHHRYRTTSIFLLSQRRVPIAEPALCRRGWWILNILLKSFISLIKCTGILLRQQNYEKNIILQEIGGDLAQGDCAGKGHYKAGAETAQGRPRHSGTQPQSSFPVFKRTVLRDRFRKCWRKLADLGLNKGRGWKPAASLR